VEHPVSNVGVGSWAPELTVSFNIRDMKYLSNSNQTLWTTTNVNVM